MSAQESLLAARCVFPACSDGHGVGRYCDTCGGDGIPMYEAVAGLLALGLTENEIAEAFARTAGRHAEDPLTVANEILGRGRTPAARSAGRDNE
jgi:hypothetical protein